MKCSLNQAATTYSIRAGIQIALLPLPQLLLQHSLDLCDLHQESDPTCTFGSVTRSANEFYRVCSRMLGSFVTRL